VLANYFGLVDTPTLAPQIPKSLGTAGPWAFYSLGVVGKPVGAISFHHAYPAVQILLLAATYICLLPSERLWTPSLILVSVFACSLVSGSRAGFVAVCFFALAVAASRPRYLFVLAALAAIGAPIGVYLSDDLSGAFSQAVERQESMATSYDDDGFAGRVGIWYERVALLNQDPVLWLTGTGYGSAAESGSNGHMLYLHITLECGLVGLCLFLVLGQRITAFLWRGGTNGRVMCYATAALMASALTQETFYPVPALGHFCGMYLFCVVIALRCSGAPIRLEAQ
jgi:O-antigen ligase